MTFTLTGTFTHQDAGATPIVGSPIQIKADPFPLLGLLQTSQKTVPTDANGQISVTLTTGVTGLYYVIRSMASDPLFQPIRFLAPASGTVDISSLVFYNPGSSPVLADILAARDAAIAAASAVQVGMWAATTAYTSGQTVNAPDGTQIKANSSRTSRASFDVTEQTFWTPVATKTGTLEQVANLATYTRVIEAPLSPYRYGLVWNGTADDTTAVQAALNAAAATATTSAEVLLPVGIGKVSNLTVADGVNLRGMGPKASKLIATASGAAVTLGKDSVLSGFYLNGTTVAGGIGVAFRASSLHSVLREMSITGHVTGVSVNNSFIIGIRDVAIQSCTTGLNLTGTTGCNIVTVTGGETQGCTNGVVIDGVNNYGLKFIGHTSEGNSSKGYAVNGATYGLSITESYMEGNTGGHIVFGGSGHFGPVVERNFFSGAATFGVNVPDGITARDITVSRNAFNITTVAARNTYLGTSVIGARVENNNTLSTANGVPFTPSADFAGTRLIYSLLSLTLPPSAATQSAGGAPLNIPHGTAPTSPNNGDIWTTTAGLFVRINGATVGPLT